MIEAQLECRELCVVDLFLGHSFCIEKVGSILECIELYELCQSDIIEDLGKLRLDTTLECVFTEYNLSDLFQILKSLHLYFIVFFRMKKSDYQPPCHVFTAVQKSATWNHVINAARYSV